MIQLVHSLPGELLEGVQPRVGVLDLGGLDEDRVELSGEEGLGQLPEEGLEQARHHVHVLPPRLLLQPETQLVILFCPPLTTNSISF